MARALVPLAHGCEELEAVTVIDLLRRAGIEVIVAGLEPGAVRASRGVSLVPDTELDEALKQEYDMVVLPGGGEGAKRLGAHRRLQGFLQSMAAQGRYTAAICAAPAVLAQAGLLEGRSATAYPGMLDAGALPRTRLSGEAVVCDGPVITSRGPGTAMDFALTLIEKLCGRAKRDQVERGLVRD